MSRRVIEHTDCDPHLADGKHAAGQSYTVTIANGDGRGEAYEIDACSNHSKILRDVADWLRHTGARRR